MDMFLRILFQTCVVFSALTVAAWVVPNTVLTKSTPILEVSLELIISWAVSETIVRWCIKTTWLQKRTARRMAPMTTIVFFRKFKPAILMVIALPERCISFGICNRLLSHPTIIRCFLRSANKNNSKEKLKANG